MTSALGVLKTQIGGGAFSTIPKLKQRAATTCKIRRLTPKVANCHKDLPNAEACYCCPGQTVAPIAVGLKARLCLSRTIWGKMDGKHPAS